MAKVSPNDISSLTENWGEDSRNKLPYSGDAVQKFVRRELSERPADFYFDSASYTMYAFLSTEDKEAFIADPSRTDLVLRQTPISFSSSMYRILRDNHGGLNIQTTTNQKTVLITIDFDVQTKLVTDTSWQSTGQGCYFTVFVDRGISGTYTQIGERVLLTYGSTFEVNVREYIASGNNRIKIVMTAEEDETIIANDIYNISMSEIYVEELNNNWYNAIVEGDQSNYKLGGFKIVGSLQKMLHIEIYSGNEKRLEFKKLVGTASYIDTPYYFQPEDGLNLSSLATGVYVAKVWISSGSLKSTPISYNFMYVAEGDSATAQLVCVNNIADKVYNYSSVGVCDYAVYNKGLSVGTPHILLQLWTGSTPTTKVDKNYENTATGVIHKLEYTIEWLVESTINLNLSFYITIGDCTVGKPDIPIDNSAVYPAETGTSFYINSTTRANTDADREYVLNETATTAIPTLCKWKDMAWVDGIDGWTVDDEDRKCLKIPAGSNVEIPYAVMSGENMTFEIAFKVRNVSDYNENIITMATNPTETNFQGIIIKPTQILVHSSADLDDSNDISRGVSFCDEETQHLIVVIQRAFEGNQGRNLVTGYVNGCKNFQFKYDSGTAWENNANLCIGSSSADVYLYFCRVYNTKALGVKAVEQNYINSLRTLEDRRLVSEYFNSVLNANTHELSFQNLINSEKNYNYFVVEMISPEKVPSKANGWSKGTSGRSNFEMHFGANPLWDFKLFNVETTGQGTTSMNYYRWNLRFRIDKSDKAKKAVDVAYYNAPTVDLSGNKVYHIQSPKLSKTVYFDGGANGTEAQHPAIKRITAKINMASSMQSHKIGATRAFNDIHNYLNMYNEAQIAADKAEKAMPTVAVYEYPAFGFAKTTSAQGVENYEFIGLFTIGPDKGDKPTFGYDLVESELMTIEGTDHAPVLAEFSYPWNDNVSYSYTNECLNVNINATTKEKAWEVGNCYGYSSDKDSDEATINELLRREFKPAYDVAFNNSTLIFRIPLSDEKWGGSSAKDVLNKINNDILSFRSTTYNDRFNYSDMQFWIEGEYVLYYYDPVTKKYVAGQDLSKEKSDEVYTEHFNQTGDENESFKATRRERFKNEAGKYWDIQDTIYHMAFILIFGATDNFAKNTYPYKMKSLENGGRWKWRQDDLDTLMGINNSGFQTNKYSIEFQDATCGNLVFAGSNSVFWNLVFEAFWQDYGTSMGLRRMGRSVLNAMAALGGGSNVLNGCYNFIKKYFWDNAQNYFPKSAYNIDANWKYEIAWLTNGQDVDPLSQSLGDHFQAERYWITKRLIYCMSLFKAGPFNSYSDTSLGVIQFRPNNMQSITVTPNMDMYPTVASGANTPLDSDRTSEGEEATFNGPFGTDGQTQITIQATDYLTSLGDLKDLPIAQNYVGDGLSITGAKLKDFKIGDEDSTKVTTNVQSLSFTNTECLETIDARNASSITGPLDVSVCTRLRELFLDGTGVTQVTLPNGSKIRSLHLGDAISSLMLKNLKFLEDFKMPSDTSSIRSLQVEKCTYQQAFDILRNVYNSDDAALQYVRLIWDDAAQGDATDISMLANIAQNKKKDGTGITYRGINAQGDIEGNPVIEGTIEVGGIYSSDLVKMGAKEPEDYGEGKKRALASTFGTLYIIYDPEKVFMEFVDPLVQQIVVENWGTNGGITMGQVAKVTDLFNHFNGTEIESFDEFKEFTGLTSARNQQFMYCKKLKNITTPNSWTIIPYRTFYGCESLEKVELSESVTSLSGDAFFNCNKMQSISGLKNVTDIAGNVFYSCTSLEEVDMPNLTSIGTKSFWNSGLKSVNMPKVTTVSTNVFENSKNVTIARLPLLEKANTSLFATCPKLESVDIRSAKSISGYAFYNNLRLKNVNAPLITSIGTKAFYGTSLLKELNMDNVTSIGESAFEYSSISSVDAPVLEKIDQKAFGSCYSLKDINAPLAKTIGVYAFNATPLTKAHFPKAESVAQYAFMNCKSLESLDFPSYNYDIYDETFRFDSAIKTANFGNVKAVRARAFEECSSLETITGLENAAYVAGYAFSGCTNLTGPINLEKATSLGYSFPNCKALGEVTAPNATSIGDECFRGTGLITAYFPKAASIAVSTLRDCTKLQSVDFPVATVVKGSACAGDAALTTVNIPKAESIGNYSFGDCKTLTSVNMPEVRDVGSEAFTNCKLTELNTPKLSKIGGLAFRNNKIEEVNLPSLSSMAYKAFEGNTTLKRVVNLGSITEIFGTSDTSASPFTGCSNLESVVLPTTLTSFGHKAFSDKPKLSSLNFEEVAPNIESIGFYAFANDSALVINDVNLPKLTGDLPAGVFCKTLVKKVSNLGGITTMSSTNQSYHVGTFEGCSELVSVELPSTLTHMKYRAFKDCVKLETVNLNDANLEIWNDSFNGCTELKSISGASNVSILGSFVFYKCINLGQFDFSNVTEIGANCFYQCKALKKVVAPNLKKINYYGNYGWANGFAESGVEFVDFAVIEYMPPQCFYRCYDLKTFICRNTTVPTIDGGVFTDTHADLKIYVPDESVDAYKAATNWSAYAAKIHPLSEYVEE